VDNPIQIGINTDPSDHNEGPGENQCLVESIPGLVPLPGHAG
jgi:hypothetical protein